MSLAAEKDNVVSLLEKHIGDEEHGVEEELKRCVVEFSRGDCLKVAHLLVRNLKRRNDPICNILSLQ